MNMAQARAIDQSALELVQRGCKTTKYITAHKYNELEYMYILQIMSALFCMPANFILSFVDNGQNKDYPQEKKDIDVQCVA
jgi:hypothetical protein